MVTVLVIVGRSVVGATEYGPGPGMLKLIMFGPGVALESRIACRSVSGPLSARLDTVNVASSCRASKRSTRGTGPIEPARRGYLCRTERSSGMGGISGLARG